MQTLEKGTDRGDVYFEPRGWSRTSAIVQELARRTQNQDSIKSIIQASFIKGDHQFARDLTDQLKDGKEFLKTLARSLPSKSLGWRIFYLEKADDEKELEEARIALLLENVKNAHQWECSYSFAKMYEKRMLEQYPESLAQIYEAVGKPLEAIKIRRLISKQVTSPAS